MALYDDVYGLTYNSAQEQMSLLNQAIVQQGSKGFESLEELKEWAHKYQLDKVVLSSMNHNFMCISHKGELLQSSAFDMYYGSILYYEQLTKCSVYNGILLVLNTMIKPILLVSNLMVYINRYTIETIVYQQVIIHLSVTRLT